MKNLRSFSIKSFSRDSYYIILRWSYKNGHIKLNKSEGPYYSYESAKSDCSTDSDQIIKLSNNTNIDNVNALLYILTRTDTTDDTRFLDYCNNYDITFTTFDPVTNLEYDWDPQDEWSYA